MGWEMVKLGDVLEERATKTQSFDSASIQQVTVKLHGLGAGKRKVDLAKARPTTSGYRVVAGDFIYSRIDARNGAFAIVPPFLDGAVVSKDFPTFALRTDLISSRFLECLCKSDFITKQAKAKSFGATNRQRIPTDLLLSCKIPLPPLEEQQRIATILDTVEEAITDATTTFESISALRQSVFKKFVRPDHPTRELGEIVSIQSGGTPSKKKPEYWGGDIPWYSPKDFKARYLSDSIDHITELAVSNANAKILPGRTPAVVVRGMILAHSFPVAVLETPGAINQDVKALHLNEDSIYSVDFLAEALRANAQYALTKVLTSSHGTKRLETEELAKLPVPVMSKDDITEFDRVFSCLTELANYREEKVTRLHELYASLSSRAFAGEL